MTTGTSLSEKISVLREKTGAGVMDCKRALTDAQGEIDKAVEILRKKGLADVAKRSGRVTKEGVVAVKIAADGKSAAMAELLCETDFVAKTPDFRKLADDICEYVLKNPKAGDYAEEQALKDMVLAVAPKMGENMSLRRAVSVTAAANAALNYYLHTDSKKAAIVEVVCEGTMNAEAARNAAKEMALQSVALSPRFVRREEVPAAELEKEKEIYKTQAANQGKPAAAVEKMTEGRIRKFYEEVCLVDQPSIRDQKESVSAYLAKLGKEAGCTLTVKRFERFLLGN